MCRFTMKDHQLYDKVQKMLKDILIVTYIFCDCATVEKWLSKLVKKRVFLQILGILRLVRRSLTMIVTFLIILNSSYS